MSFGLTPTQVQDETKDVTRRLGWLNLKPGDLVRPVRKCMGLKAGEKIEALHGPIRIVEVRREALGTMLNDPEYGRSECRSEGFPELSPSQPDTVITRIKFEYLQENR